MSGVTWPSIAAHMRLSISYRRAILNTLLHKWQHQVRGTVLDVGGIKGSSLGFTIPAKSSVHKWLYLNIRPAHAPDIVADAAHIPLATGAIDTVVCLETLEHVVDPLQAARELSRVLRPSGLLLLSVPFLYRIHSAPNDFWRFTEYQVQRLAKETDLEIVSMERVGLLFTVLCDMTKQAISQIPFTAVRWLVWLAFLPLTTFLVCLERLGLGSHSSILTSFTTGYLLVAMKAEAPGDVQDTMWPAEGKP